MGFRNTTPVLIVEDDRNISSLLQKYLQRDGFDTISCYDGKEARSRISTLEPSLIVLDIMLPGLDGWSLCEYIRTRSDTPILLLTARSDEDDRIRGLSLGADDYVTKPFSPREVVERVKAILRRSRRTTPLNRDAVLRHGRLRIDPDSYTVTCNEIPVELTPSEFDLLYTLMTRPGRIFTRSELLNRLPGQNSNSIERAIDVHIGNLRQKIEDNPSHPKYILTRRGIGYYFNRSQPAQHDA